jgi:hypothetical protein
VQQILAQRNWSSRPSPVSRPADLGSRTTTEPPAALAVGSTETWQPLGPTAVNTASYGLVTGRISSIAFDPSDPTGNRVYIGSTGGGVWLSQNAATSNPANVLFVPRTDAVGAMATVRTPSISVGAITVQPGGTGVVLAGTGDTNDGLDSYYGAGILRSVDGGNTWSLIQATANQEWVFAGEGFAGFAWSTVNPQLVVAAVSEALEGSIAGAPLAITGDRGLYYSTDSGATWSMSRITDGNGTDVQGPVDLPARPDGNAATSVVWNPIRNLFIAAVRYHGYYQSPDGVTWNRLSAQPGSGLTTANCPTNPTSIGSPHCPIFRGTLAVNPQSGDTFAWTVDGSNQDQGLWEDVCAIGSGACTNRNLTFANQWSTTAIQTNDPQQGPATIEDGDYTLVLAAVPSAQDTVLFAGTGDLWQCSLAAGCNWRNTTHTQTCRSAQVAPYQHALAWNPVNPSEILIGNDSGLWRSLDEVGETGPSCDASDASHFQNLNGAIGSLTEVATMAQAGTSPRHVLIGLRENGTAGVKGAAETPSNWPQILDGLGGPVAIDPSDSSNWFVNNEAGVSIHRCSQRSACQPSDFGSAVVTNANVGGDGNSMALPATFVVDPLDSSQLLIATCRVWRGPADGVGWTAANAISPFLDGAKGKSACNGDPLIRTIAAAPLPNGKEMIYAGFYGWADGGSTLAGHLFSAIFDPGSQSIPIWHDLTHNPVNDTALMNSYGLDISSIYIDPHDATGNTVYVTVDGMPVPDANIRVTYRSIDGGAHWLNIASNLLPSPANSIVVDPLDANTVYIALDSGVYSTRQIGTCITGPGNCWSAYGTGLPGAPVTQLRTATDSSSANVLIAGTYGRGIWQIPLWTTGTQLTTAAVSPTSLTFPSQAYGSTSSAQTISLTNTGGIALTLASVTASGDFSETDNCQNTAIASAASCKIQVTFTPAQGGTRTGQLTIGGNMADGQISIDLAGTGLNPAGVALTPSTVSFGQVAVGATSDSLQVTAENPTSSAVAVASIAVTAPFVLSANGCGSSLAAKSDCQLLIRFAPAQPGQASGTLAMAASSGALTVALSGNGAAPTTDTLSSSSLTFPGTMVGQTSAPQTISLTNSGGMPLTSIASSTSGPFQVSSNCTTQLAGNSSCTLSVSFDPPAPGAQTGTLLLTDALRTQTVALSGTGLQPPQLSVNPAALSFPAQAIGAASSPSVLTIGNTGGAPMANVGFQVTGQSAASFSVGATTCGALLKNGSSCTAQVIFTPVSAGGAAATLIASSSTLGVKPVQVALTGNGQALSGINVTPAQMSFTVATLGQPSAPQRATISNTGALAVNGLLLATSAPFSVAQSSCGTSLAAGASCSVDVIFAPAVNAAVGGTLTISSTTSNAAAVILSGIGGAAGSVQLQPSLLSFAATGVNTTSSSQTIALTNSGPVDLVGLALQVSSSFQLASTTCNSILPVGAGCTAAIVFSPASPGQQTGTLTLTSTALATPVQATLAGMGFDFAAAVSGSSSQTISSGQTANFVLVLTPKGGSSGTFTFQCGSLPADALCSFNPASETVAANSTGNVTVQIATGHSARSVHPHSVLRWHSPGVLCALAFIPIAFRRRWKYLGVAAICAISFCAMTSCSGSGGGTGGTPSGGQGSANGSTGTYSIPVSVSSNGIAHTVTLTLTVD